MKKYLAFYIPYLAFVFTFVILVAVNTKADLHLWMTSFYCPASDIFFHYYTYVGDWIPYLIITVLLFYRYRIAFLALFSQLASGLISIVLKHMISESRPSLYFQQHYPAIKLHQVAGEHLHSVHSFPSGHTITAFAFFMCLAFFTRRPAIQFLYFVLALLVGYSRIYLSQHFAIDVLAGSLIGVTVSIACFNYLEKYSWNWKDGSLLNVFSKKKQANSLSSEI